MEEVNVAYAVDIWNRADRVCWGVFLFVFFVLVESTEHLEDPTLLYFLQELMHCISTEIWLTLTQFELVETLKKEVSALSSAGFLPI